jgi:hypothetical protein
MRLVMRVLGLTTAAALCTSLAVGGAGAVDAKKPAPRLQVTKLAPLAVRGSFFRVRERVRLTIVNGEQERTRTLRASRMGSFTAAFDTVYVHPCSNDLSVTAVGVLGSRASAKVPPPADCPPPP